jgi:glucosyl-3-phosphoglycerate synthase
LNIFHHSRFANAADLATRKRSAGHTVSVCIPTLDEAATIGGIVATIRHELMNAAPLVDEILVIDSGSTDGTRELAARAGATVHISADISPELGTFRGKGENLWKALCVARGDLICYIDGDIANFHPRFVTGLVGPLLHDPGTGYVKAFYERPLDHSQGFRPTGGGRVSEILVRPLLSLFYPELTRFLQPLSGEYAARRGLLESLAFPTGYGVEIAHLIDISRDHAPSLTAQTDLDQRHHRNRTDTELGRMAFAILQVILRRLQRDHKLTLADTLSHLHRTWQFDGTQITEQTASIPEPERPPWKSIKTIETSTGQTESRSIGPAHP